MLRDASNGVLMDKLPIGIIILNSTGRYQSGNRLALQLFGIGIEDLIDKSFVQVVDDKKLTETILQIKYEGASLSQVLITRNKRTLKCSVQVYSVNGDESDLLVAVEDVTALRKMEEIKKEFLSNILYRLRTPLSSLKTGLSHLGTIAEFPKNSDENELLNMCSHEANRLHALLSDLRALFSIETGISKDDLELENFEVSFVLRRCIEDIKKLGGKYPSGCELITLTDVKLPQLHADFEKTKIALTILIKNALQFSLCEKPISIMCEDVGDSIDISVVDKGIGIQPNSLDVIGEKFFREDNEITRSIEGNGLGLFIARSFVTDMGGHLYFESRGVEGTVFHISLPAVQGR